MSLTKIKSVDAHSPAQRAGVRPGETLTHINGRPIVDVLDYKFFAYDPRLELTLVGGDGRSRTLRVRKAEGEELGLNFETYLMDKARSCANRCIFCFVDQMPPGMRETLYFKDDDARLSFLMGNYITLTNLSEREIARIAELRISPSTSRFMPLIRLREPCSSTAGGGVSGHHGAICCGGHHHELPDRGLPRRQRRPRPGPHPAGAGGTPPGGGQRGGGAGGGDPIPGGPVSDRPYTPAQAAAVLDQVEAFAASFLKKHSTHLAWCSDEFYLLAGRPLPEKGYYEDMAQLENGVGMLRLLTSQAAMALEDMELEEAPPPFAIATGVSAAPFLQKIVDMCREKCGNIIGNVYPMVNRFSGRTITVSGSDYRTGSDRAAQGEGAGASGCSSRTACSGGGTDLPGRRHCGAGGGGPGGAGDGPSG